MWSILRKNLAYKRYLVSAPVYNGHKSVNAVRASALAFCAIVGTVAFNTVLNQSEIVKNDDGASSRSADGQLQKPRRKSKVSQDESVDVDVDAKPEEIPGVYAWGSNRGQVIAAGTSVELVKIPKRIEYFDGRLLRDLDINERLAVAVLDNGDVVQWGGDYTTDLSASTPSPVVEGCNIVKVKVADKKCVYGLPRSGNEILVWPISKQDVKEVYWNSSWWNGWGYIPGLKSKKVYPVGSLHLQLPNMKRNESIKDLDVGKDHILVLTSKGRVFSGSTGLNAKHTPSESKGQYGIPSYSQFDEPPIPGTLHEIKTFRNLVVEQIATGDYHSISRTNQGKVYVFGENIVGQLGIPYTFSTANIAVPTLLPIGKQYSRSLNPFCTDIAAGGSTSYAVFQPISSDLTSDSALAKDLSKDIYAFGNGLVGQLGNNAFVHAQSTPVRIHTLMNFSEYSEDFRKAIQIEMSDWSVGKNHTAVIAGHNSKYGRDVFIWGGNEFSQLGTGKRNNIAQPLRPSSLTGAFSPENGQTSLMLFYKKLLQFRDPSGHSVKTRVDQVLVAGDNITAVYYRRSK